MPYLLTILVSALAAFSAAILNPVPVPQQPAPQALGTQLPSATAVFETSLAAPITSSASSMTLTGNSVRGGGSLSGYQCFTLDEGSAQAETVCGTVSGTAVSSLTRGISQSDGTSTVAALQFAHRRGANVKITDFPVIQILKAQNNGEGTFENPLRYASGVTPTNTSDLTDKEYVDGVAFNGAGVIDATTIAKGVVELATGCEAASSTSAGGSGTLVVPASGATSTYNSSTLAACKVVVAGNGGKIDTNFISTSTTANTGLLDATSTIKVGDFPAWQIGKNIRVFSSTGTTTFTIPEGITKVKVQVVGAGGGGGGGNSTKGVGSGGGGGGYALEYVDVTGTTSVQVFVGTGGTGGSSANAGNAGQWSTFGTNGSYLSASGGSGGLTTVNTQNGGAGGIGANGDLNLTGNGGCGGRASDTDADAVGSCGGGSAVFGGGAFGVTGDTAAGGASGANGGGGGGGVGGNSGGNGGNGLVVVEW